MKKLLLSTAFVAALPAAAMAETGDFSFGVGESLLGHTVEGGYRFSDKFGMRGQYGTASFSHTQTEDGNDYNGDIELGGAGLWVDFYPTAGAFRMSAGALKLDHTFDGTTTVSGAGGSSDIAIHSEFKKSVSPAVSIGFSKPLFGGPFNFNADLGAAFTGGMTFDVTESSGQATEQEIEQETAEMRDFLADLKVAPFVKVGVSLNF